MSKKFVTRKTLVLFFQLVYTLLVYKHNLLLTPGKIQFHRVLGVVIQCSIFSRTLCEYIRTIVCVYEW